LTASQLLFLYDSYIKREKLRFQINASLHGIKLDDDINSDSPPQQTKAAKISKDEFLFRDPVEYEKMSSEERERLTKKMMQHYSSIKLF
jgi:hypothetical protein